MRYFITLILTVFSPVSFASINLDFSLDSDNVILINAPASSCEALAKNQPINDIPAIAGQLDQVTLHWKEQNALNLHWVKVELNGPGLPGGKYTAQLAGDALLYTWDDTPNNKNLIEVTKSANTQNRCPIKFGEIRMNNRLQNASGKGMITIYGSTTDESGTEIPVMGQKQFQFYYIGSGL